ncbi:hypothetical protein FKW77_010764 [Venturia effusa]|uniref:RNA polymerase Rpb4/RPC9 core domain-containing protein n=1 Tax=Venturia effusa TaxID=50376 RepID=A0A517KYD6_9PEZI|nr:hypothetical protein FKW77_010764 [Venturia effusa]
MATNGHTASAPDGYVIKILNGEIVRAPYVPARKKPGQEEDEEAGATIRLGPDFQDAHALSVSEARLIVEKTEEVRKKTGKKLRETENLLKMQTYMDTFARFRSLGTLNQIETLLANYESVGMDSFEKAQLVSLACVEAEEAKTLIPSLSDKISDEDLTNLCEQISQQRQFMDDA